MEKMFAALIDKLKDEIAQTRERQQQKRLIKIKITGTRAHNNFIMCIRIHIIKYMSTHTKPTYESNTCPHMHRCTHTCTRPHENYTPDKDSINATHLRQAPICITKSPASHSPFTKPSAFNHSLVRCASVLRHALFKLYFAADRQIAIIDEYKAISILETDWGPRSPTGRTREPGDRQLGLAVVGLCSPSASAGLRTWVLLSYNNVVLSMLFCTILMVLIFPLLLLVSLMKMMMRY